MRREPTQTSKSGGRGQSELVGIILLFGMVIGAAGLVFVAGSSVTDSLQSETEVSQVELTAESAADQIQRVANDPDAARVLPTDTTAQYEVSNDGVTQVGWHNESDALNDAPWSAGGNGNVSDEVELGAIELAHDDVTYVHQAGGIWRHTDDGTVTHVPPEMEYNGDRVWFNVMSIDDEGFDSSDPTVSYDAQETADLIDVFNDISPNPELENYAIRVESEYADAWESAFESRFDASAYENVTVQRDDEVVVANFENLVDGFETGPIVVTDDYGIDVDDGPDNTVAEDEALEVIAGFENKGNWEASTTTQLEIYDGDTVLVDTAGPDIDDLPAGEDTNETLSIDAGDHSNDLEPGEVYEYNVRAGEMDELNQNGTFLYLHKDDAHFEIDGFEIDEDAPDLDIDITATIVNTGAENATKDIELTLDGPGDAGGSTTTSLSLDRAATSEITWTINETRWPAEEYNVTLDTQDDDEDSELEVENESVQSVIIEDDLGIEGGAVVGETDNPTFQAELNNTFVNAETRDVTVTVYDDEAATADDVVGATNETITIGADTTKEVTSTFADGDDLDAGEYWYDIDTGDDSLETLGEFLVEGELDDLEIDDTDVAVDGGDVVKPTADLDDRTLDDLDRAGTLEVTVDVSGGEADEEQFVELQGFDGDTVDVASVESKSGTVTLEWSDIADPGDRGNAQVTVQTTEDESEVIDLDGEGVYEPRLDVEELSFERPDGDAIEPGEDVEMEVTLESVGGSTEQDLTISNQGDEQLPEIEDASGTETREFTLNDPTFTQYVTVETEDDELREPLVVERDGPEEEDCDSVDYDGEGNRGNPYQVSNIDELQCINENDLGQQNEAGRDRLDRADTVYYELVADIPAHGTEYWNDGKGFEPIGPEGNDYTVEGSNDDSSSWEVFSGTFDGQDHTVENLTIDRPNEQFVGLFGATGYPRGFDGRSPGEGSIIKNTRLSNVSVHGERHVGGLVGQAGGQVIDSRSEGHVEAEYQLVGGLVGDGAHADLDNRLVAEGTVEGGDFRRPTNEEESFGTYYYWNRGIGGLIGRSTWETDVSTGYTQVEVEGPSMVGGITGSSSNVESDFTQMYAVAEVTIDGTSGADPINGSRPLDYKGAVAGTIENDDDRFARSVYHDRSGDFTSETYGEEYHTRPWWTGDANSRTTDQMTGFEARSNMSNLDFQEDEDDDGNPWVAVKDDYPRFAWEAPEFIEFGVVGVDADETVTAGDAVEVDFTVNRTSRNVDEVTETVILEGPNGNTVDTQEVTLTEDGDTASGTLQWRTSDGEVTGEDAEDRTLTVRIDDDEADATTTIEPIDRGPGEAGDANGGGFDEDVTGEPGNFDPGQSAGEISFGPDADIDVDIDVVGIA